MKVTRWKKIVFAEKREVSSSQELRVNKLQLMLDNNPKLFKLLANTVPLFPFTNFLVCNDKAEKRLIGAEWKWRSILLICTNAPAMSWINRVNSCNQSYDNFFTRERFLTYAFLEYVSWRLMWHTFGCKYWSWPCPKLSRDSGGAKEKGRKREFKDGGMQEWNAKRYSLTLEYIKNKNARRYLICINVFPVIKKKKIRTWSEMREKVTVVKMNILQIDAKFSIAFLALWLTTNSPQNFIG